MKSIVMLFLLCSTANAVDVSELAKAVKREFGTGDCSKANKMWIGECRTWVLALGALARGPKREAPKPIGHYDRPPLNATKTDYEIALEEARRMAQRLRKERVNMLRLLK